LYEISWPEFLLGGVKKKCWFKIDYTAKIYTVKGTASNNWVTIDSIQRKILFQPLGPFTESELVIYIHGKI